MLDLLLHFLCNKSFELIFAGIFTVRRVCMARTMLWQDVCLLVLCVNGYKYRQSFFHHRVAPPF